MNHVSYCCRHDILHKRKIENRTGKPNLRCSGMSDNETIYRLSSFPPQWITEPIIFHSKPKESVISQRHFLSFERTELEELIRGTVYHFYIFWRAVLCVGVPNGRTVRSTHCHNYQYMKPSRSSSSSSFSDDIYPFVSTCWPDFERQAHSWIKDRSGYVHIPQFKRLFPESIVVDGYGIFYYYWIVPSTSHPLFSSNLASALQGYSFQLGERRYLFDSTTIS